MIYSELHGAMSFSNECLNSIGLNTKFDAENAYQILEKNRKSIVKLSASDAVTAVEYYRNVGAESRANALLRAIRFLYPADLDIAISWSIYLSRTKSPLAAINFLENFSDEAEKNSESLKSTLVWLYSKFGIHREIEQYIFSSMVNKDNALKSRCLYALRKWKEAKEKTENAIQVDPENIFLKKQLIDILLALGEVEKAKEIAIKLAKSKQEIEDINYYLIFVFFALGDIKQSIALADDYLQKWRSSDYLTLVRAWLIRFLALNGNHDLISSHLCKMPEKSRTSLAKLAEPKTHKILDMPIRCQGKDMCVPTAIAMMCHSLEIKLSPESLYKEMGGIEGTELWRAQEVLESKGLSVEYVSLDIDTIKKLVDKDVPLLVVTQGLFSSHVEVINGYDDAEGCIYIKDPMNWHPNLLGYDAIEERYQTTGNYGITITQSTLEQHFRKNSLGFNLNQLHKYSELSHIEKFKSVVNSLKEYHQFELEILQASYGITVSPFEYEQKLVEIINSSESDEFQKIRALIQISDPEILSCWLENWNKNQVKNRFLHSYISIIKDYLSGYWEKSSVALKELLELYPYQSSLWLLYAEVNQQTGHIDQAIQSVDIALELSPDSIWVISRILNIFPHYLSYSALNEKLKIYEDNRSYSIAASEFAAQLYYEGAIGERFERKATECIKKRPLIPSNYNRLASWYLVQGRDDLAKDILEQGREKLGLEEIPLWSFEQESDPGEMNKSSLTENQEDKPMSPAQINDKVKEITSSESLSTYQKIEEFRKVFFDALSIQAQNQQLEIEFLLPESLPGVFPHNLNQFLDEINFDYLSLEVRKKLLTWVNKLSGEKSLLPNLAFNTAYLVELTGDYSLAEQKYNNILQKYSGHAGAYYRLAILEERRENLSAAITRHEQAIKKSPSLIGSIDSLIQLNYQMNNKEQVEKWCKSRADFRPYEIHYSDVLFETLVESGKVEEAIEELNARKKYFTENQQVLHKARIYADAGMFSEALTVIGKYTGDDNRHISVTKVLTFSGLAEYEKLLDECEKALNQNRNDKWFMSQKLEALLKLGMLDSALKLVETEISQGEINNYFINKYFELKKPALEDIKGLIISISGENKESLIEVIVGASEYYFDASEWKKLLIFVNEEFVNAFSVRIQLSYRYMMAREHRKAIDIAEDVYNRSGKNEVYLFALGKVYEDTQRKKALKLYQDYFDRTGDNSALIEIGRCYHIDNNLKEAKQHYEKALALNPYADIAVNNLVQMGGNIARYANDYHRMIENGYGQSTQYFFVNAIKCALAANLKVSENWLSLAEKRLQMTEIEHPFKDEKERLSIAIYKWYMSKDDKVKAKIFRKKAGFKGFLLLFKGWPGRNWIP